MLGFRPLIGAIGEVAVERGVLVFRAQVTEDFLAMASLPWAWILLVCLQLYSHLPLPQYYFAPSLAKQWLPPAMKFII